MTSAPQKIRPVLPSALEPGDTIGIAAPAGVFDADRLQRGLQVLKAQGFKTVVPRGIYKKHRYLAGTDQDRASIVNALFRDKRIRAVLCARGGVGSLRILPWLDFAAIRGNPKIFSGFSDISALLSALFEQTGLVTFHGPVVTSLAEAGRRTIKSMATAFMSNQALVLTLGTAKTVAPGHASGVVRGGNLASLCQLAGTPYQPDLRQSLLLLEDINEPPYRIDRMLSQLQMAGCLDGVVGVMLGRFERCGDVRTIYDVVRSAFPEGIPILAGLPVGHKGQNRTLPLGLIATLDADEGRLQYHGPAVSNGQGEKP
jgi:muramoyltetrapeptide carboxypeptidase